MPIPFTSYSNLFLSINQTKRLMTVAYQIPPLVSKCYLFNLRVHSFMYCNITLMLLIVKLKTNFIEYIFLITHFKTMNINIRPTGSSC